MTYVDVPAWKRGGSDGARGGRRLHLPSDRTPIRPTDGQNDERELSEGQLDLLEIDERLPCSVLEPSASYQTDIQKSRPRDTETSIVVGDQFINIELGPARNNQDPFLP